MSEQEGGEALDLVVFPHEGVHPGGVDLWHLGHCFGCGFDEEVLHRERLALGPELCAEGLDLGEVHLHREEVVRDGSLGENEELLQGAPCHHRTGELSRWGGGLRGSNSGHRLGRCGRGSL
jgi:hypothetical protein